MKGRVFRDAIKLRGRHWDNSEMIRRLRDRQLIDASFATSSSRNELVCILRLLLPVTGATDRAHPLRQSESTEVSKDMGMPHVEHPRAPRDLVCVLTS